MEQKQGDRRPSSKWPKIAIKGFLGFFITFLISCVLWLSWRLYFEDYAHELLHDFGFGTVDEHPQSEEDILLTSARWKAYYERQYANNFDMPPSWFLNEDGNDTGYIYGPYKRAAIHSDFTEVTCWPTTGGFWTINLGAVDLDFLGLNRLKDTPRSINATEENEFCERLQKLGPIWYEDELWYRYSTNGYTPDIPCFYPEKCPIPTAQKPPVFYGYPSTGGLWVLELVHWKEKWRTGMGKLNNVFTMDERSKVIEMLGGKFYADSEEYWATHPLTRAFTEFRDSVNML